MPGVAVDTAEARAAPLRGWGRYADQLVRALRALGAPVIELHGRWPGPEIVWEQAGLPLGAALRGAGVLHAPNCFLPLVRPCAGVVTVHDLAFETHPEDFAPATRWKYRVLGRAAARSADRVICVSAATAADVVARWGVDAARVRVVPNAPALPLGSLPVPNGAPYLLGIGDLRRKKAWDVLVRAWRASGLPHRLVIAGVDAGEGPSLRALAGADGARLDLPGYVDDARLDALLRGASALAHPSLHEGFGLVVVEAMARGVPVVCADDPALAETAGGAALVVPRGDAGALAEALVEVAASPGDWAERGRSRAAAFTWERSAALTWDVYRELL